MKLVPITLDDTVYLQNLLAPFASDDPYAVSPAYLLYTGRHGLWVMQSGESLLFIARHPNIEGEYLAFPPLGAEGLSLLRFAGREFPALKLARFPSTPFGVLGFGQIEETILDWKHPIHTLCPNRVTDLKGPTFRTVRSKINHARRQGCRARPLRIKDEQHALALALPWSDRQAQALSRAKLIEPHSAAFKLLADPNLDLDGLAFECGDRFVGYRIWERPRGPHRAASSIAALTCRNHRGLSEFAMHTMAKHVAQQDGQELCVGGSETAGLDAFKRKFNPIRSVSLSSLVSQAAWRVAA